MTTNAAQTTEQPHRPIATGVALAAGVIAALMRIVPHPPNVTGIGALGLFGGARLSGWRAYAYPIAIMLASMFVSDFALWTLSGFDANYSIWHLSRTYVYASFVLYVLIGRWLIREDSSLTTVALAATLGGVQFFVLTNFCNWLFQPFEFGYEAMPAVWRYSRDFDGLVHCFAMALPFANRETAYTDHPFMLFTDFQLSLFWACIGDVVFSVAYFYAYAQLKQRAANGETPSAEPIASNG